MSLDTNLNVKKRWIKNTIDKEGMVKSVLIVETPLAFDPNDADAARDADAYAQLLTDVIDLMSQNVGIDSADIIHCHP